MIFRNSRSMGQSNFLMTSVQLSCLSVPGPKFSSFMPFVSNNIHCGYLTKRYKKDQPCAFFDLTNNSDTGSDHLHQSVCKTLRNCLAGIGNASFSSVPTQLLRLQHLTPKSWGNSRRQLWTPSSSKWMQMVRQTESMDVEVQNGGDTGSETCKRSGVCLGWIEITWGKDSDHFIQNWACSDEVEPCKLACVVNDMWISQQSSIFNIRIACCLAEFAIFHQPGKVWNIKNIQKV